MNKFLTILLFLCFSQLFSQVTEEQKSIIKNTLLKKVNALRKQKGIHQLEANDDLAESAKLHSVYMSKNKTTVKEQEDELFKTTKNRVDYHNHSFDNVSENVIKTKAIAAPFFPKKLNFVASIIYNSWKKSSDATKNMLSNNFTHADFGITYNEELKQFFVSNVFGNKKHKVSNQLSEFAFGIKESSSLNLSEEYRNNLKSLASNISIENNEVFLEITNFKKITEIITNNNDGFAADLIAKNQIQCGVSNKLDASPIYDGTLLKPVYKNQILGNKKISLGNVPDHLKGQKIIANLIVLKENLKTEYIVANNPSKNSYDLLPIKIELEKPYIDLQNQGIFIAKEIFFDFESSQSVTDKYTEANFDLDNIKIFSIKSYTSVDGSESSNKALQNKRAQFIKKHIGDVLGHSLDHVKIRIDARENWPLYNYQLKLYGHKHIYNKSKVEKRSFANNTLKNSWNDKQFAEQRKSKIIAFKHGYWNRNNKQHGFYNLLNGLITDDVHLINKSLIWLYNKEVNYDLNKDYILDRLLTNKDLVQNVAALFSKNIEQYDLNYLVYFLDTWLPNSEILTEKAQKNLLHLYTKVTHKILYNWNEENQNYARILHPENVEQLFKVYKSKTSTNALFINYNIIKAEYFKKIRQEDKIKESFDFILSNYDKYSSTIEEKVNLASFFKQWEETDLSFKILLKEYENNTLNDKGILLLTQMLSNYYDSNNSKFDEINKKAISLNAKGWCEWINENFQKLADNTIKKLYCSKCN